MRILIFSCLLCSAAATAIAADLPPDQVIQKFAAKEAEFRKARENYTYTQSVKVEELDPSGSRVQGKWEEVEDVTFGPNKQRLEKVTYAPMITLQFLLLTPEDLQDLRSVQPFVLTTEELPKYDIQYIGKEQVDGKGWCPTYTHAKGTLHFKDADQRIRMTVKYENYKRFGS